jgi:microcystin-dependent protein
MSTIRSPLSNRVITASNGTPDPYAKIYITDALTSTPITVYVDANGATAFENDSDTDATVLADANGKVPTFFIPYGDYGERVTLSTGVQLWYDTKVPNPAPIQSTSSEVPDSERIKTGFVKFLEKAGTEDGFVRQNGRTIGNAVSGATERANADTATLYAWIWNNKSNTLAAVSSGRGANAAADYAANKTITLTDMRFTGQIGLDGMGNSAANRATGISITGGSDTAGSFGGAATHVLDTTQIPAHNHGGATTGGSATLLYDRAAYSLTAFGSSAPYFNLNVATANGSTVVDNQGRTHSIASQGGGLAHSNMHRFVLGTFYQKL